MTQDEHVDCWIEACYLIGDGQAAWYVDEFTDGSEELERCTKDAEAGNERAIHYLAVFTACRLRR